MEITNKELIEIIEGCVYNSQVLIEERVCFNELRKELNEELPEQLTLTDVVKSLPIERPKLTTSYDELIQKTLTDASQQRELLLDFWMNLPNTNKNKNVAKHYVDKYLKQ